MEKLVISFCKVLLIRFTMLLFKRRKVLTYVPGNKRIVMGCMQSVSWTALP
jgi:hypothetical protein